MEQIERKEGKMKKGIKYSLIGLLAVIIIALTGASFYMLGYSLRPEHNKGKDILGSYIGAENIFPFVVLRSQRVAEHVETRTCEGNNDNC